ncbi:MAG: peptidylprolyl isomerase [Pseudomonadota bacterium]
MKAWIFLGAAMLWAGNAYAEQTRVLLTTTMGDIVIELDPVRAPLTVANFLRYVDAGAYDNTLFHRVIPGFMIQGGGRNLALEELPDQGQVQSEADNGLKNLTGTVAMARTDDIDSASRDFFINVKDNPHLDHSPSSCTRAEMAAYLEARERGLRKPLTCDNFGYAVFGRVVEGMDVVYDIEIVETTYTDVLEDLPAEPVVITRAVRVPSGQGE